MPISSSNQIMSLSSHHTAGCLCSKSTYDYPLTYTFIFHELIRCIPLRISPDPQSGKSCPRAGSLTRIPVRRRPPIPSADPYPTPARPPPQTPKDRIGRERRARHAAAARRRQGRPLKSFSRVAVGVGGAARKVGGSGFLPVGSPPFLPIDVIVVDVFPLIFHSLFFSPTLTPDRSSDRSEQSAF